LSVWIVERSAATAAVPVGFTATGNATAHGGGHPLVREAQPPVEADAESGKAN
jgi:hypothetical protein